MTLRCKFSPLGKPEVDSYKPGTIIYEDSPTNYVSIRTNLEIKHGVFELMCCSGGGGQWCYIGCNHGAAGSFFKGIVYFDHDQTLDIQVGAGSLISSPPGDATFITNCINCPGGVSANSSCYANTAAPTLMDGMQVLSQEICAGGVCDGASLFPGLKYGAHMESGYMKLTYLRIEP